MYKDIAMESCSVNGKTSETLREEALVAYQMQRKRYAKLPIDYNVQLSPNQIKQYCVLNKKCASLLEDAFSLWNLSARSYHRILKVARTIADLSASQEIQEEHVLEALSYRMPDRFLK